ncbi:MAG: hypothetical protein ACD_58C00118G0004 [uncultured bacterium]|nr:MAG: hypothetical protein ACD_58C00118G0004 [uncultured bacterium]
MGIKQPEQSEPSEEFKPFEFTVGIKPNTQEEIQWSIYSVDRQKAETQYLHEKSGETHKMPENFGWSESAYHDLITFIHFYNFNRAAFQELMQKDFTKDLENYVYKRFYSDSCEDYIEDYDKIKEISDKFDQDISTLRSFLQNNYKETGYGIYSSGFEDNTSALLLYTNDFKGDCRIYLNFNSVKMIESLCEIFSKFSEGKVGFLMKLFKQTSRERINRRDKCVLHISNTDLVEVINIFREFAKSHPDAFNTTHPGFIAPIVDDMRQAISGISVADPQGNVSPGVNISGILVSVIKRLSNKYPDQELDVNDDKMLKELWNILINESKIMSSEQPERFTPFNIHHPAFKLKSNNYQVLTGNGLIK